MSRGTLRRPYKDLSLQQLRSFCDVCRLGGYAPAARELLLTTSAVWEQLKALERHYGVPLFERDRNRVRPTFHGQRLLELVRPHLIGLDSTRDVLHEQDGVFPEQVTIVTMLRVLTEEVGRAMCHFRRRYPAVRLVIRYTGPEEVETLVLDGKAHVTLTLEPGPSEPVSPEIEYEAAGELDYLLVTPPRHPLLRKKAFRLQSLLGQPLILATSDTYSRHRVEEVFHHHGLMPNIRIVVETSSDEYTVVSVRAGLGIGIAVGNPSSPLYKGLGVRSLRHWFGTARVGFLWRRGAHILHLQRELAELLQASLAGGD